MTALDVLERLGVSDREIARFCGRWNIAELAVFGSAARGDLGRDSDVDVMLEYLPGSKRRLSDFLNMKAEMELLFRRPVDIVRKGTVENPFLRTAIARDLITVYAA